MADRFLLHKPSGVVFIRAEPWISNPEFEEVADAKGTPFTKKQRVQIKQQEEVKEPETVVEVDGLEAALSAQASRGLP
jgi:hypothetical protein